MASANKTADVTHMKCAHPDCNCVIDVDAGVQQDGRLFCDEQCATGAGCGHRWCGCGTVADDERYRHEAHAR